MSSPALKELVFELSAAKLNLVPIIEGYEDYLRLNIFPETKAIVQTALDDANRRLGLLDAALTALEALDADNYPEFSAKPVTDAIYADLLEQRRTIEAALGQFHPENQAVTVTITPGTPEPK